MSATIRSDSIQGFSPTPQRSRRGVVNPQTEWDIAPAPSHIGGSNRNHTSNVPYQSYTGGGDPINQTSNMFYRGGGDPITRIVEEIRARQKARRERLDSTAWIPSPNIAVRRPARGQAWWERSSGLKRKTYHGWT
uniref:Uncharacterized protein n=1 Tax=Cacopsylla melanoneura TaxID=428564 RepID=A0A8D8TWU4_9HEMI